MSKILINKIQTPDGTVLVSRHRHNCVTYTDENGLEYMVDGGNDYLRRTMHQEHPHKELSVTTDDDHETIRDNFEWGTYEVDGNQPLRWVLLKDMSTDHIEAILKNCNNVSNYMQVLEHELKYRDHLE